MTNTLCSIVLIVLASTLGMSDEGPIEIGTNRQLFLDDLVIASTERVARVIHSPERYDGNPILTGSRDWEKWTVYLNGRGVLYDEEARLFKMWYMTPLYQTVAPGKFRYRVGYAVSSDGIHWSRPELGLVPWKGSPKTNLLPVGENWLRRVNVIKDRHDPDEARRYKMIYADHIDGRAVTAKAFSSDGIHWDMNADKRPLYPRLNENLLGWDPRIQRYVLFGRTGNPKVGVGRASSVDFLNWSQYEPVLAPTPQETDKVFNGLAGFLYDHLYLGLLWIREGRDTGVTELVTSRDGVQWRRLTPGKTYFGPGPPGSWDGASVRPVAPVVCRDRIWIYYGGWNTDYTDESLARVQKGWVERGTRMQRAIGLATLRLDGFVSMQAGPSGGRLTTKPLRIPGGTLRVNADIRKEMRVEILDLGGGVIPGFRASQCAPIRADRINHHVKWQDYDNLDSLKGRLVRLRFIFSDGDLYSFHLQPGSS